MTIRLRFVAAVWFSCAAGCAATAVPFAPVVSAAAPSPAAAAQRAQAQFAAWSRSLEKIGAAQSVEPQQLRQGLLDILAVDPNCVPAQYNLMVLDELTGAQGGSSAAYAAMAAQHAEFAPGIENAAALWAQQGDVARAAKAYGVIIAADPKNQTSRLALARIRLLEKNYAEAIDLCRVVLARQADAIEAFRVLAHCYVALADTPMAELVVSRGLRVAPKDVELHEVLADIFLSRGETTLGVASLKKVITMAPQRLSARAHLATVAQSFRDFGNAAQNYEAILALEPGEVATQINLAVAYKSLGRFTEADTLYQKVLQQDPNNLDALWNRGVLCQKHLGHYDEATAAFSRFAALAPASSPDREAVVGRLADIGRRQADTQAQAVRQARDKARMAAIEAACAATAAGKPVDGARIGLEPERVEAAWQQLAEAQRQAQGGNVEAATAAAACGFALLPTSLSANTQACAPMHVAWTQMLYQLGRPAEAQKSIEAALVCDAKNPDAQLIAQQLKDLMAKGETAAQPSP